MTSYKQKFNKKFNQDKDESNSKAKMTDDRDWETFAYSLSYYI